MEWMRMPCSFWRIRTCGWWKRGDATPLPNECALLHRILSRKVLDWGLAKRSEFARKEVYPVNIDVLEGSMTDTATDVDRSQNTEISAEYLAQLRELAESQGWSLDGTVRRALAVTRAVIRHPEV
jgi:hypothetical protein